MISSPTGRASAHPSEAVRSIQPLHLTGHAMDGIARHHVHSRVSVSFGGAGGRGLVNLGGFMYGIQLRLAVGFTTFLALCANQVPGFAQVTDARKKAAQEAAVSYAMACNRRTDQAAAVMKVAAVPFFPGIVSFGGSGPRVPIDAPVFKEEKELLKWLGPRLGHPSPPQTLSLKIRGVESYADFRKKYLEKEPAPAGLDDLPLRLQQAAREALDQSVGKDGLIVFLGEKSGLSEGVLVRFEKGTAKVAGVLGVVNPEWKLGVSRSMLSASPEGK